MRALCGFLGENDMMAYLTIMANRLLEPDLNFKKAKAEAESEQQTLI